MDNVKCLVFDFDGTIANTYNILFEIMTEVFDERGLKMPKATNIRSMGSREILKKHNISMTTAVSLAREYRKRLNKNIKKIKMFSGLKRVLRKLSRKYDLGIVTSNTESNVNVFLNNNELSDVFDFIETGSSLFGKHRKLRAVVKKHGYKKSEVAYVADETRDIEAARKVGIKIISVGWGYNSARRLKQEKPDYLITNPEQLLKLK